MPLAGGAGTVDEFGVGGGCPGVVVGPVSLPPFCEAGSRIRQRALQHLEGGDASGAAGGGEDSSPGGDAAFLLAGIEEHECRMRRSEERRVGREWRYAVAGG